MADPASLGPASANSAASESYQSTMTLLISNELAADDLALANCAPIMRHLLWNQHVPIYGELIVARVRGMFLDVARQLVIALAHAAGQADPQAWAHEAAGDLAALLAENPIFLAHFHALALEWQLAERLQARAALDPVVSRFLKAEIASVDPEIAGTAMDLLAAQARFGQAQRSMQLPLAELPGDLFHVAMLTMRTYVGDEVSADGYAVIAERTLRAGFDEQRSRLALVRRVLDAVKIDQTGSIEQANRALDLEQSGVALFLTALANASALSREAVTMATTDGQRLRLALALCASGLDRPAMTAQFYTIHPEAMLPGAVSNLDPHGAAALLRLPVAAF